MPTFVLDGLGWKAFQDLCATVLREQLGQTVTTFAEGADAGRDAAFFGVWSQHGAESVSGSFAVQVKFRSNGGTLSASDIRSELPKIRQLHRQGLCDAYVLMTNARVTGPSAAGIRREVLNCGPNSCLVIAGGDIDSYLRESPRLRTLVPRVYGLGDLSQILDERAIAQAQAILESMREDIAKFVVTDPYRRAVDTLNEHGFVLLLGEPAVGKTMIAAALAIDSLDLWKCRTIKARSADIFEQHWNPHEPGQFVWVDDAFGTTQYQARLTDEWNRVLPLLRAAIARGTRVVLTSRDYIWHAAQQDLKLREFEPLRRNQVLVEVRDLTPTDRQQILYNHLRMGNQPKLFKSRVKPFLDEAAAVTPFLPEVARRFSNPRFTSGMAFSRHSVSDFFRKPVQHLEEVIEQLSRHEKAAIALLFMAGGQRDSAAPVSEWEQRAVGLLGSSIGEATHAFHSLEGSMIVGLRAANGSLTWTYKHPTISEAFGNLVSRRPDLMMIQISGMSVSTLVLQVTCGDAGLKNAIVVPPDLYPVVIDRLRSGPSQLWSGAIESFLTRRVDDSFLRLYLKYDEELVEQLVERRSVRLAARIHRAHLLPATPRESLVLALKKQLLEESNATGIRTAVDEGLLTDEELNGLLEAAIEEVLPHLARTIWDIASDYDGSDDIDSWLEDVSETVGFFVDYLEASEDTRKLLDEAEATLLAARLELEAEWPGEPDPDPHDRLQAEVYPAATWGSVFSDVDD
jgi:hypothetical protein